jgi:hypothetical protein
LIQFIGVENVEPGQKTGMARGKKTFSHVCAPQPTFLHHLSHELTVPGRRGPILNIRFCDKQNPSDPFHHSSKLVENAWPKLRH